MFVYITKEVSCRKCGWSETGDHLQILADDEIPQDERDEKTGVLRVYPHIDRDGNPCRPVRPRMVALPHEPLFRKGERVEVFAPQTLNHRLDQEYPLKALHGREVTVLDPIPDIQGLVLVEIRPPLLVRKQVFKELPVLQGLLQPAKKEGRDANIS